ncbi:nuclear transport factor 2 family protein [Fulvivirgaceae bacterium BMA10]|uniref:Nuclear transport factor 2 family protein n=1 Tax=Splendidivirga corallicola TaxID=3051826 RepID=A0ABT8KPM4_9BACT|nr:nuclear transport factor 2 family protein [Fulvivirgaceae bacterium BMA10]
MKTDYFDGLQKFDHEFLHIDITGETASVKLKLIRNGILIFTDYITLLKFGEDWKIVTKIYHTHVDNPWEL